MTGAEPAGRQTWTALTRLRQDTTFRAAFGGGGWMLVGTAIGRVAHVVALLYAAAQLGSAEFGALSLALSTALVVTSISSLGLPVAVMKLVVEASDDIKRRQQLIDASLGLTVFLGILAMGAFFALSTVIASWVLERSNLWPLIAEAAPLVLLTPCVEILAGLLTALERFRDVGIYRAAYGCTTGLLLGLVLVTAPGGAAALGALAMAAAITCALGWLMLAAAMPLDRVRPRASRNELRLATRSLRRVSFPALAASVSLQSALWVGQVVLSRQPDGLRQVGIFAVALRWHSMALFVPATMALVLLPMLGRLRATGRQTEARVLFIRYGSMTLVICTATCLVLISLASVLMALQGSDYAAAAPVLVVLAVATIPTALNNVLSQRALAEDKLALWVGSDLVLAGALVGAALVLVPTLKSTGLACSYLAAYIATCAVLFPVASAAWRRTVSA